MELSLLEWAPCTTFVFHKEIRLPEIDVLSSRFVEGGEAMNGNAAEKMVPMDSFLPLPFTE